MGFLSGYDIATSGMFAQRTRINVVSANIANAKTTHAKDGNPYVKHNVIFEAVKPNINSHTFNKDGTIKSIKDFDIDINIESNKEEDFVNNHIHGVKIKRVAEVPNDKFKSIYEPTHPDADENGYVKYPNINPVIEMVDLIESMRIFEANTTSFKALKENDTRAIDMLKG